MKEQSRPLRAASRQWLELCLGGLLLLLLLLLLLPKPLLLLLLLLTGLSSTSPSPPQHTAVSQSLTVLQIRNTKNIKIQKYQLEIQVASAPFHQSHPNRVQAPKASNNNKTIKETYIHIPPKHPMPRNLS